MSLPRMFWRKIDLGDSFEQADKLEALTLLFENLAVTQASTDSLAIFTRHENEHSLHCRCIAYLSPGTAEALNLTESTPCATPQKEGLSILAGSDAAWKHIAQQSDHTT